jgi:hypothetical protein
MKLAATVVLVALLASACGGSDTYSAEEAAAAFEEQGLALQEGELPPPSPTGSVLNPWGSDEPAVLVPSGGAPLFVYVGSASEAEAAWTTYESRGAADAFDARRGNVLAISDGGLSEADRARVRAALESLPDRGSTVLVSDGSG